jgi:hypothetical protein
LAFFGLTELQNMTQYMFEETFRLNFRVKFEQHPTSSPQNANITREVLDQVAISRISHLPQKISGKPSTFYCFLN